MEFIGRSSWGAAHGAGNPTSGRKIAFYVHHSGAAKLTRDSTLEAEKKEVRRIEKYHASDLTEANPRVGYTFLLAPSARLYEGTGWGRIGAHTKGHNSSAYACCLLLDGTKEAPSAEMVQALNELRIDGIEAGHLIPDHKYLGHRDSVQTECPGDLVYNATVAVAARRASSVPPVTVVHPTLRRGSGGKDAPQAMRNWVVELQKMLELPEEHHTGFFGPITHTAVTEFQTRAGLKPDGIVGIRTWQALEAMNGGQQ
jgi:N-acetylmuramoyl-L-alanine amidase